MALGVLVVAEEKQDCVIAVKFKSLEKHFNKLLKEFDALTRKVELLEKSLRRHT